MRHTICFLALILGLGMGTNLTAQESAKPAGGQNGPDFTLRAQQSMALVVIGDGNGQTQSVIAGVIIRSDGIVLTPYHFVKGAREVQVRTPNGETYDQAEIVGIDERRDVAALHFGAFGLSPLTFARVEESAPGEKVHAITADGTLAWISSEGVFGSVRLADEVLGAGRGYRVVQFKASIPAGAPSGALLNSRGQLLGIITSPQIGGGAEFAVPVESVAGLSAQGLRIALGSGKNLTLPPMVPGQGGTMEAQAAPGSPLAASQTLRVDSTTSYFTPFMLEEELLKAPGFRSLGINVVTGSKNAKLVVNVDRPLFTYDFTFSLCDSHSGVVLATGKATAIDGPHAAKGIATQLIQIFNKDRAAETDQVKSQEAAPAEN